MGTSERFSLRKVPVLSSGICALSRLTSAIISPGNYGSFTSRRQLFIPVGNVGTVLTFPSLIKDYLYIDVVIHGGIAGISILDSEVNYEVVGGIGYGGLISTGITGQSYTVRLPYSGPVNSLLFTLEGYIVREISVVYSNDSFIESRSLAQITLQSTVGWTDTGTAFEKTVFSTQTVKNYLFGTLLSGNVGKIKISVTPISGLSTPGNYLTFFDGVNSVSYYFTDTLDFYFEYTPNLNLVLAYFEIINETTESFDVSITPTVLSPSELSTAYGTV